MENSGIEWTDHTFNPWWGCQKVSDGCKFCYAETLDNRFNGGHWGPGSTRKSMSESYWNQPYRWDRAAAKAGVKHKVFCASMADVFEDHPDVDVARARLFTMIEMTPNLIWLLLTKRPENIQNLAHHYFVHGFPGNVWIGTSAENQQMLDRRLPYLINVPAVVRFLSCEPLLGPLEIPRLGRTIDWVIVGGESGKTPRPMDPDWVRSIRDQCEDAAASFFFKQWGGVNKKEAGAALDGKEYKEFPL